MTEKHTPPLVVLIVDKYFSFSRLGFECGGGAPLSALNGALGQTDCGLEPVVARIHAFFKTDRLSHISRL